MKTKAVRMYGERDLRLEEFELPEIKEDEILAKVMSDSICMSTYKLVEQGKKHKRAPQNIDTNPVIIGHEFAGVIIKVGEKWKGKYHAGMHFAQQPALNYRGSLASPGYSYEFCGGDCTYCIFPNEVMELGCLMEYRGDSFFEASLGEPMSCCIGGYYGCYHTNKHNHDHCIGTKADGNIIILGGCGPMGLGCISYGIQLQENRPQRIVVTDVDDSKIIRAKQMITEQQALVNGVDLVYVNTSKMDNPKKELLEITEGKGYDDVFVLVSNKDVVELADSILAFDGCMNFFAGPMDKDFKSSINLYNTHYISTHIVGTTGGNNEDLIEANELTTRNRIEPAVMVTHVGGIDSVIDTTRNLPNIDGGKKMIYTQINMPLTPIEDFDKLGEKDELFRKLGNACRKNRGLWSAEAERILFEHYGVNEE